MSLSFRFDKMSLQSATSLLAIAVVYLSIANLGVGSRSAMAQDDAQLPVADSANRDAASADADAETKPAAAEPPASTTSPGARDEQARFQFNFSGADWRMVLEWLAGEAGLSLQMDRVPSGTVNYIDHSRTYTLSESMDIVNQLLLKTGFALVRRGQLLMLIDLESDNAAGLISEVAELVTPDELSTRADSDIVRCVFPLGGVAPETAKTEIAQLIGPAGRAIVLDSSKQVVVTETVGKLKAIRTLLENAATSGSEITEIVLKHRVADEILEIARPLLGLEPGMNSNESIRIATGLYGDRLYATGQPLQCALLQSIVERADTPLQVPAATTGDASTLPKLETYPISNVDPSTVIDVLQTLLAGVPDTRIATDPQSRGVIAYARPETHALIRQTIDKLEGKGSTFEVIQLRRLEPSQALLTINKFFGITAENPGDGPTVDGDPVTGKLWVRGTAEQIQLIRDLIDRLEGADAMGAMGDRVRLLPYTGRSAEQTLEQLQMLWEVTGRKNKIRMVTPSGQTSAPDGGSANGISFPQRRIAGDRVDQSQDVREPLETARPMSKAGDIAPPQEPIVPPLEPREIKGVEDAARAKPPTYQLVAQQSDNLNPSETVPVDEAIAQPRSAANAEDDRAEDAGSDGEDDVPARDPVTGDASAKQSVADGEIVISMTPSGMIVASDDPQALADFEEMMRTLADQTSLGGTQPTVFWLKYAKAQEAADLATKILGGGDTSSSSLGSSGGSVLSELGGGMLGGLLGFGGGGGSSTSTGPVLTATGSVRIIPAG
ncbi:MAG: secretin N-terminal domain-containing protein, partial [Planctomycetaceae bacterium]